MFSVYLIDSSLNRKEMQGYQIRRLFYLAIAQSIYNLFLALPFFALSMVFFNIDPLYFVMRDVFGAEITDTPTAVSTLPEIVMHLVLVLIRNALLSFLLIALGARYFAFIQILDCCRVDHYDHFLTVLQSKMAHLSSLALHRIFSQLRLCHIVLAEFYNPFYFKYMTFCQYAIVLFIWMSIVSAGRIPIWIWLCLPTAGVQIAIGACVYIEISFKAHDLSRDMVELKRKEPGKICWDGSGGSNRWSKKLWNSVQSLDIRCGEMFHISRATVLVSLHLLLTNLGSLILLNEDRNAVHVTLSY